jgi:hypothetical protein
MCMCMCMCRLCGMLCVAQQLLWACGARAGLGSLGAAGAWRVPAGAAVRVAGHGSAGPAARLQRREKSYLTYHIFFLGGAFLFYY